MSKVGRNEPCHCGSGKKYKKCCLESDERRQREELAKRSEEEESWGTAPRDWDEPDVDELDDDELDDDELDDDELDDDEPEGTLSRGRCSEFQTRCDFAEGMAGLREVALEAIRQGAEFSESDGDYLLDRMEARVKSVDDARAVLEVLEAWQESWPESLASMVNVGLLRTWLATQFGVGELEPAVMAFAREAGLEAAPMGIKAADPLAWRGETALLIKALTTAWPLCEQRGGGDGPDALMALALRGIEAHMAAESEGLVLGDEEARTLRSMAGHIVGEQHAEEYLQAHRRRRGGGAADSSPPSEVVARATLEPRLEEHFRAVTVKLTTELGWPATRAELAATAWMELVGRSEPLASRARSRIPPELNWALLTPTGPSLLDWWRFGRRWLLQSYLRGAALLASLPCWFETHLADAPVSLGAARELAEAVRETAGKVVDGRGLPPEAIADLNRAVEFCSAWAESRGPVARPWSPPAYLDDPDIRGLFAAGDAVPGPLWRKLVARGKEVLPLLHEVLDDFFLDDLDEAVLPGESRYVATIHAAFIAAEIGDLSSVPHVLEVAGLAHGDEWLYEGLVWFPKAFGPGSLQLFLAFIKNRKVEWYPRAGVMEGVVWAAGQWPELRETVTVGLIEALDAEAWDTDAATSLVTALATTGDKRAEAAIRRPYGRMMVGNGIAGDLEEFLEKRGEWFLRRSPPHMTTHEYFARRAERESNERHPSSPRSPGKKRRGGRKAGKKHGKSKKKKGR